jgi:hypothetical protein
MAPDPQETASDPQETVADALARQVQAREAPSPSANRVVEALREKVNYIYLEHLQIPSTASLVLCY